MSKSDSTLTAERLRELLHYDPETGVFTWNGKQSKKVRAGAVAGYTKHFDYVRMCIDYKPYLAHRLAWFYVHGIWPKDQIDHANGVRNDNRIDNLREATNRLNRENQHNPRLGNASGLLGVSWSQHVRGRPWRAQLKVAGRTIAIGRFATPEEAYAAYLTAKRIHHPGCTI